MKLRHKVNFDRQLRLDGKTVNKNVILLDADGEKYWDLESLLKLAKKQFPGISRKKVRFFIPDEGCLVGMFAPVPVAKRNSHDAYEHNQ